MNKLQGPSDTYRDLFEPGWREKEAERDRMLQAAFEKVPMSNPADELTRLRAEVEALRAAIALAYGWLWCVNNEPGTPRQFPPEKAAYEARKVLRDWLTKEQRGQSINLVLATFDAAMKETKE
jgi:hypothetical protein